jgi:hypothetical protein
MTEVKIGQIRGKTAKAISDVLDCCGSGIIIYKQRDDCGKVLDIYTENGK